MNNKKAAPLMNEDITVQNAMTGIPHFIRYDEGLKEFIKNFFVGNVVISPVDEFWEFYTKQLNSEENANIADEDRLTFPAVSFYPGNYSLTENQNNFATFQLGPVIQKAVEIRDEATNEKEGNTVLLSKTARALYFDIPYQINVWALDRASALQLVQELLFPLFQHKEFQIKYFNESYSVPYQISSTITNNSFIGMNSESGTVYRYSFDLLVTAPIFESKNFYNALDSHTDVIVKYGPKNIEEENG